MKRQESLRSLPSQRETVHEKSKGKTIGCMSGIFHVLTKYQNRRKFLTSARRRDKDITSSLTNPTPSQERKVAAEIIGDGKEGKTMAQLAKSFISERDFRRFSCEVPRSPTLPAEIRRSNSVNSPETFRSSPALVARLMGLGEIPPSPSPESTAEKRQKLLGALEKCDEDLRALKQIIDAVRSAGYFRPPPLSDEGRVRTPARPIKSNIIKSRTNYGGKPYTCVEMRTTEEERRSEFNGDQPSPVSVLERCFSSPLKSPGCHAKRLQKGDQNMRLREDRIDLCFFHRLPRLTGHIEEYDHFNHSSTPSQRMGSASAIRSSKAMIESVHGVCRDVALGERRELGRIGLVLQSDILGDLIEETVRELGCWNMYSLPLEACKRRLCF